MRMKQNCFFFLNKFENGRPKKAYFSKSPIFKKNSPKFLGLYLGLVELIDAKGIDMAQPIWP